MTSPPTPDQAADEYFEYHFAHRVAPDHHPIFLRCQEELRELIKQSPGYIDEQSTELRLEEGVFVGKTVIRFDTLENLIGWLDNPERRRVIHLEENAGYKFQGQVNTEGYSLWLKQKPRQPSPVWKINLLVLLVLYPTVMGLNLLLHKPDLIDFPTWMLFSNFCSVAITGWFAVPWVSGIYQRWLEGQGTKKEQSLALASIILALLLLLQFFRVIFSQVG